MLFCGKKDLIVGGNAIIRRKIAFLFLLRLYVVPYESTFVALIQIILWVFYGIFCNLFTISTC